MVGHLIVGQITVNAGYLPPSWTRATRADAGITATTPASTLIS